LVGLEPEPRFHTRLDAGGSVEAFQIAIRRAVGPARRVMLTIRPAVKEDAAVLWDAERRTAMTPGLLASRPGEIPVESFEEKIEALATRGRYVVAEIDGRAVGHAFLEPLGNLEAISHVFALTIVVHPGMLGQGIGAALLRDLLEWARRDDRVTKVELRVRSTNTRAIALYTKLGFVEEGRFRRRIRLPDGALIDDLAMAWFPEGSDGEG
jgi:RimJ/RimL family protein N-acetyltransferase